MAGQADRKRMSAVINEILDKHSLKKTELRKSILHALSQSKDTMSQGGLIEALEAELGSVDRVSIYRNLNQLKAAGVIHEIDSNNYIFCEHECNSHAHLLLYCQSCHKHKEVKDHVRIQSFMDSLGDFRFFGSKNPIFLRGVCSACTVA